MLSVDADHATFTLVAPADTTCSDPGTDGAAVSPVGAHACVDAETVATDDWFPAASNASTPSWYAVPHVKPLRVAVVCVVVPTLFDPR